MYTHWNLVQYMFMGGGKCTHIGTLYSTCLWEVVSLHALEPCTVHVHGRWSVYTHWSLVQYMFMGDGKWTRIGTLIAN